MDPTVCIANIGPGQRALRMRLGVTSLAAATMIVFGGAALGLTPWSHGFAALWIYGGFLGVFQARGST